MTDEPHTTMGDFILDCMAEAAARGLERPDEATRKLREIQALKILACGNVSQREAARFYAETLKTQKP